MLLHGLSQHVRTGVPDDAAPVGATGCDGFDLNIPVRHPGQVTQHSLRVSRDHDRVYRTWLAPVVPGLPPLPVRIEAEGTYGTVLVHLTGTGSAAARPKG